MKKRRKKSVGVIIFFLIFIALGVGVFAFAKKNQKLGAFLGKAEAPVVEMEKNGGEQKGAETNPDGTIKDPWLNGFSYRKPIHISNSGSSQTNFQIPVTVYSPNTASLYQLPITISSTGTALTAFQVKITITNTTILSHIQSDGRDIRFFTAQTTIPYTENSNKLDYWIESISGSQLDVWVETDVPAAGDKVIYMYYGNSNATAESNGTNTFLFFDSFSGGSIDTNKWTVNAVNSITHTVNNYFRFETASQAWIYNNTDSGSQHQAIWTPTSSFVVDWRSTLSDTSASQMGEGSLALVGSDNLLSAYITHTDDQGASIVPRVGFIFVETTTAASIVISNGDVRDFRYVVNGTSVKIYEKAASSGTYNLKVDGTSSSISKLALAAGKYSTYSYLDYIQIENVKVRKYAATEPSTTIGSEALLSVYELPINISSTGTALTAFQVRVAISDTTILGHIQSGGADIRIFSASTTAPYSSTSNKLDFWIESLSGSQAVIWVETDVPASGGKTIYMYYGLSGQTSESNGDNTFLFFDNFPGTSLNTSKWNSSVTGTGSISVSNGITLSNPNKNASNAYISMIGISNWNLFGGGYSLEWYGTLKNESIPSRPFGWAVISAGSSSQFIAISNFDQANNLRITNAVGAGNYSSSSAIMGSSTTARFRLYGTGSTTVVYVNDTQSSFATDYPSGTNTWLAIGPNSSGGNNPNQVILSWIFMRKRAATEPSASFGTETSTIATKMNSDFSDVRFTRSDGYTLLDHWSEGIYPNNVSYFWVEVDSIPAGDSMIYMYYGNSSATSAANGVNTFLLFDDFGSTLDGSKWTTGNFVRENSGPWATRTVGYNTPDTTGGLLRFSGTRSATDAGLEDGVNSGWWGKSVISVNGISESNFRVRANMWFTQSSSGTYANQFTGMHVGVGYNKDNYINGLSHYGNYVMHRREVAGTGGDSGSTAHTFPSSTWTALEYVYVDNNNCWYTAGSDSISYASGQSLGTRKVFMGFSHRAPSATVTQYVDWIFVRKYAATDPVAYVGAETQLVTMAGTGADSWSWKAPAINDKVRNGSATNWSWVTWQNDGAGLTLPYHASNRWVWYPGSSAYLYISVDDGVRCYINGQTAFNQLTDAQGNLWWNEIADVTPFIVPGTNTLACWVANGGENSGGVTGGLDIKLTINGATVIAQSDDDGSGSTKDANCSANVSYKYWACSHPCEPTDWFTVSFDDSGWSTDYAPFGPTGTFGCTSALTTTPDDLFIRKTFTVTNF